MDFQNERPRHDLWAMFGGFAFFFVDSKGDAQDTLSAVPLPPLLPPAAPTVTAAVSHRSVENAPACMLGHVGGLSTILRAGSGCRVGEDVGKVV